MYVINIKAMFILVPCPFPTHRCLDKESRSRPGFEQILAELVVLYKEVTVAMAAAIASQQPAPGQHLYTLPPLLGTVGTSYLLSTLHRQQVKQAAGPLRAPWPGNPGTSAPVNGMPGLAVVSPSASGAGGVGGTTTAQPAALDASPVPSGRMAEMNGGLCLAAGPGQAG